MCGHATLGAAHILLHGERIRFSTRSGILTVTRDADDPSLLKLDMPSAAPAPEAMPELLEALDVVGETFISRAGNGTSEGHSQARVTRSGMPGLKYPAKYLSRSR